MKLVVFNGPSRSGKTSIMDALGFPYLDFKQPLLDYLCALDWRYRDPEYYATHKDSGSVRGALSIEAQGGSAANIVTAREVMIQHWHTIALEEKNPNWLADAAIEELLTYPPETPVVVTDVGRQSELNVLLAGTTDLVKKAVIISLHRRNTTFDSDSRTRLTPPPRAGVNAIEFYTVANMDGYLSRTITTCRDLIERA